MVDFAKLRDPVYQAEAKARRETEDAASEAHEQRIRKALDTFSGQERFDSLSITEQSFIKSCERVVRTYGILSEKQQKWLFDLVERARGN